MEKEENEWRERKNGQTAVWQILWDVVEGWWCFHCWHQHKFSWRGSPCPAWAQHWETGEEILWTARERNQRAGVLRPLTHWTPRWPYNSLLFSHTHTHTVTCTEDSQYTPALHSDMCTNKSTHKDDFQDDLGSVFITLCLLCLIFLKTVHLLTLGGGTHWPASELWGVQWFNEPCLRSLIKITHTHGSVCIILDTCVHTRTHAKTCSLS